MRTKFHITLFLLLALLVSPTFLFGGARIVDFEASQQNNTIIVQWASEFEYGVLKYVIERSVNNSNWETKKEIEAYGDGESNTRQNYSYVDKSIFKSTQSHFSYRLKIVDKNGSVSYYGTADVLSTISGIRHTWGSIKASFR